MSGAALISFMCMYLAAKFEGEYTEELINYKCEVYNSLNHGNTSSCTAFEFEGFLMQELHWNTSLITAEEFIGLILDTATKNGGNIGACDRIKARSRLIIDLCLISNQIIATKSIRLQACAIRSFNPSLFRTFIRCTAWKRGSILLSLRSSTSI